MWGLVGAWLVTIAAACDGSEDLSSLTAAILEADRSLSLLDPGRFAEAVDRAQAMIRCIREPVSPALAASLHRAVGVRAFGGRAPLAAAAFAAARRIEPGARLSPELFPPESPVYQSWSALSLDLLPTETLAAPAEGWIALDGVASTERTVGLPVVFQRFAADRTVADSAYLLPDDPAPPYALPPLPVAAPVAPVATRDGHAPLIVTAAVSGLAGASLWGLAAHGRTRYVDTERPVPDDRLDGLRTRTNALAVGSLTGIGIATVSGALLVATW